MQVNKRGLEFLLQASIYFIIAGTYMNKEKNSTVQDYTREMAFLTEFNPSTERWQKTLSLTQSKNSLQVLTSVDFTPSHVGMSSRSREQIKITFIFKSSVNII